MHILGEVKELKNHFTEDNLLKEHGGSSDYKFNGEEVKD
jgi:hypothetical protein